MNYPAKSQNRSDYDFRPIPELLNSQARELVDSWSRMTSAADPWSGHHGIEYRYPTEPYAPQASTYHRSDYGSPYQRSPPPPWAREDPYYRYGRRPYSPPDPWLLRSRWGEIFFAKLNFRISRYQELFLLADTGDNLLWINAHLINWA